MTRSTRFGLGGIAALAVLSGGHWLRARLDGGEGVLGYVLGVLPNLAAAVAIPFVALAIWADRSSDHASPTRGASAWTVGIAALGLAGWEGLQLTSSTLRFDVHDLGWTGIGAVLAGLIADRILRQPERES